MAFYQVEKEINGKKYVFQHNGLTAALEAIDDSYIDGSGNISMKKLTKYLFQNVVVEPRGLTPDDFDSMDELSEVTSFARKVMNAEIKPNAEEPKKAAKTKAE